MTTTRTCKFCFLAFLLSISFFLMSCSGDLVQTKQISGEEIIKAIENFRDKTDRLPKSLTEVGIAESEEGPIYYRQRSETRYELWYGAELGESVTYDSERKSWQ